MERFLQYLFDGLSIGSVYSLFALGLVIVYRGTGHLNFAQGEMALFCTYVMYQFGEWGIPVFPALAMSMAVGFALGAITEVTLVRPVARRSPFAVFIVTIGLFQLLNWACAAIWGDRVLPNPGAGSKQTEFPALFPSRDTDFVRILGAEWRYRYLGVLALAVVMTFVLFLILNRTRLGLAMRAVASNRESAKLVGIGTGRVLMICWGLAAAFGALGGVVFAGITQSISVTMMFTVFVYGSAAAMLGGLDSPGGAVLGGLIIGVVENMAAGYQPEWVGQELKLGVAFAVILVVLLVRPSGLFGTAKVERV